MIRLVSLWYYDAFVSTRLENTIILKKQTVSPHLNAGESVLRYSNVVSTFMKIYSLLARVSVFSIEVKFIVSFIYIEYSNTIYV